ncbi:MAG: hypothetical protein ALECFALPRED_002548 [Alectoria fallacina]|uniref:Uncharacterized protein n=1 Tax=Alectoria fallacina TaxID=1903189 RepID=A0A8H3FJ90_9LECA|nr:MAG: hypothetical protein ALECFALPRED_002548 [Alectoria fallacina]
MRFSTATPFSTALVLVSFFQAISALTLSAYQPIDGFSAACTNAYNTPLTDCSSSDFEGQGCSAKCIGFLDNLRNTLLDVCAGTVVYPNTLIGLFFDGEGVQTLCSNAGGSSSSSEGGGGVGQSGGQDGAYGIQSTAGAASASSTSTSTSSIASILQVAATSSTPQAAATSLTPQAAATSSTTTTVPTTVTPEPTTTSVAVVGTTVTPASPSDTSTSTSRTKSYTSTSSTSTSTGNGNGGGTPLDIVSSACHDAAVSVWLFALLAGSAGVAWLL